MKVLQVYKTSIPTIAGGVDAVLNLLAFARHDDYACAVLRTAGWDERDLAPRQVDGVDAFALHFPLPPSRAADIRNWLRFVLLAPLALWKLHRLVRSESIDVVHLHTLQHYHLYFSLLRLLGGLPYVVTLHGSEVTHFANRGSRTQATWRWVLRHASAISAVSATLRDAAVRCLALRQPIAVLPNGVALPRAALPGRADIGARFGLPRRYGVVVGTLMESKAQATAIRAWAALPPEFNDVALVLVGAGAERDRYTELARELGMAQRVIFTGQVDHLSALAIVRDSQLTLVPSRKEGFGMVVLEAGMLGVPLVVSAIEVFRELVRAGVDALVCDVDDHAAFSAGAALLLGDRELADGLRANFRARVAADFDFKDVIERYYAWYRAALAERAP